MNNNDNRQLFVNRKNSCSYYPIRSRLYIVLFVALSFSLVIPAHSQIGGRTSADGTFVLDDAEDLDLVADGVMRDWIPDYVWPQGYVLTTYTLTGSSLTLAPDQTPIGALKATIPETHWIYEGYISAGFGVPVPAVKGASTEEYPGNITSFGTMTFNACFEPVLTEQVFQVVLETYPGPDYPKIYWSYSPESGTTFQGVEIDLWNPDTIEGAGSLTLQDLLSQTRFLYFYFYAGPVPIGTVLEFYIDDIRLTGEGSAPGFWVFY